MMTKRTLWRASCVGGRGWRHARPRAQQGKAAVVGGGATASSAAHAHHRRPREPQRGALPARQRPPPRRRCHDLSIASCLWSRRTRRHAPRILSQPPGVPLHRYLHTPKQLQLLRHGRQPRLSMTPPHVAESRQGQSSSSPPPRGETTPSLRPQLAWRRHRSMMTQPLSQIKRWMQEQLIECPLQWIATRWEHQPTPPPPVRRDQCQHRSPTSLLTTPSQTDRVHATNARSTQRPTKT